MEAFVQGSISTLGYLEDGVYFREPDCYGSWTLNCLYVSFLRFEGAHFQEAS